MDCAMTECQQESLGSQLNLLKEQLKEYNLYFTVFRKMKPAREMAQCSGVSSSARISNV